MYAKKPKISVIMSTYNRKSFLTCSVESVLSQTYKNFEFILVNNGSTDGSDIVCKKYAKKDHRIKIINIDENHGASNGKNRGIDIALGDYITIVDDDDYCEPQMLEFLWDLVNKYNADIAICGSWNDFGDRLEPYFIFDDLLVLDNINGLNELLKREKYNVAPPTKLFRKNLFDGIRFKGGVLIDDIHIIYKVFANASTIVTHGKPLYHFRKHDKNMTSFIQSNKLSPNLLDEYLSMYKERTKYLSKKVPEITERARYSEWSYMTSMCNKIEKYQIVGCEKQYNYMVKTLNESREEFLQSPFITEKEKEQMRKYITFNT